MYKDKSPDKDIWIISGGKISEYDKIDICGDIYKGPVKEYRLSELGCYLLNPQLIRVSEKVVGCEFEYRDNFSSSLKRSLKNIPILNRFLKSEDRFTKRFINTKAQSEISFNDKRLEAHIKSLEESLRNYDPVIRALNSFSHDKITDIRAVCEEPDGSNLNLKVNGTLGEKAQFIKENLYKHVDATLNRAYLSNGIYDLRGFDFKKTDFSEEYKLKKFSVDGDIKSCVFKKNGEFMFKVQEDTKISHLILLDHSLKADNDLKNAILSCKNGKSSAYKLFFSKQTEYPYSINYLPGTFRKNLSLVNEKSIDGLAEALNSGQRVVSFSKETENDNGEKELFTNISVMHELSALNELKEYMPDLYTRLESESLNTDAGPLYLLDSLAGFNNGRTGKSI